MNLIPARYKDGGVEIAGHRLETSLKDSGERDVVVGIRPGAVRIAAGGIPATVELVEDLGDTAILDLDCGGTSIRARVSDGDVPREGDRAVDHRPAAGHSSVRPDHTQAAVMTIADAIALPKEHGRQHEQSAGSRRRPARRRCTSRFARPSAARSRSASSSTRPAG